MSSTDANSEGTPWVWMLVLGILMILAGIFCYQHPFAATLSVTLIAALGFAISGIMYVVLAFTDKSDTSGSRFFNGLLGVSMVIFAIFLFRNPLAGVLSLTLAAALMFLIMGCLRIFLGIGRYPENGWFWIVLSGLVSIVLSIIVFVNFPVIAVSFLGILLAVDLLVSGVSAVMMSFAIKGGKST